MIRSYKTDGIILKRVNVSESDRIITIFTKEYGKLRVLGKGVRKITSRRAPHLEVFTHTSLFLARGTYLDIVTEAQTIQTFSLLRKQLSHLSCAFWIIEELERLCPDGQESSALFFHLLKTLEQLNSEKHSPSTLHALRDQFSLNLLWELGYLSRGEQLGGAELDKYVEAVLETRLKSRLLYS